MNVVPTSFPCRNTGKKLGCTAGTWFINDYDSIFGLYVKKDCLRGQKMSGSWTSPYIMQVTRASFFSFSLFIMQKHEQMQILLALIAKLSFLLLLCIPPAPSSYSYNLIMKQISFILIFWLCFSFLTAHKCSYTFICIFHLCRDIRTPLCPPLRLGATRVIHLHSSGGERGATRGTNI